MTHCKQMTAGVICGGVLFLCSFVAPAQAASNPGSCAATSGGDAAACQYEVEGYTQAPLPTDSMGIRFDAGINNVLFNSFSTIGPRFVHNASGNDIFVPQKTAGEFSSFLGAPPSGVTIGYAVAPRIYTAVASPAYVACGTQWPSSIDVPVPTVANTTLPVVVNSYSLVLNPATPTTTQTIVGSPILGGSPAQFTFTREDCSKDDVGNKKCVTVTFVEDQQLVFSAVGTQPNFSWGVPTVTSGIYMNNNPANCATSYAPSINGLCGAANGGSYAAAPTTGLCSSGNASAVTAGSDGSWNWVCSGVSGGTNQFCATVPKCNLPWGGSISGGSSVTAYAASTVPYGGTCQSETRSCNSSTLSGSYAFQTCTVQPPAPCNLPWGGTINSGNSIAAYAAATVPNGSKCQSQTRTCTDGTLSGGADFSYQSCTAQTVAPCNLPWGGTISSGSSVAAYAAATVPYGSSCQSQTRTCTNGTLSGSYAKQSCTVQAAAPCNLPWGGTINSGSSVTAYAAATVPSGSKCQSQVRICNNGTLSGGTDFSHQSCAVAAPTCTPTSETQTVACPDRYPTGTHTQQRNYTCANGVGTWGPWSDASDTCHATGCLAPTSGNIFHVITQWGPGWSYAGAVACQGEYPIIAGSLGQTVIIPSTTFVGKVGATNNPHGTGSINAVCTWGNAGAYVNGGAKAPGWDVLLPGDCH